MRAIFLMIAITVSFLLPAMGSDQNGSRNATDPFTSARACLVSISVKDLDEAVKWYQENLGFQVVKRMEFPKYTLRIAFADRNDFRLELIEFKQSVSFEAIQKQFSVVDDRAKIQGLGKYAFRIDNIEGAADALKKKGVKFEVELYEDKEFSEKTFIISDNSGNWIQFFQKVS